MSTTKRDIRKQAKVSLLVVAATCGVGETTVRIYEIDPDEIQDKSKRETLDRYYDQLARRLRVA